MPNPFLILVFLSLTVVLSACEQSSRSPDEPIVGQEDAPIGGDDSMPVLSFTDVMTAAESALAIAESKRNVWSKTESLLAAARAANKEGRTEDAIAMAKEARLQAELAATQADTEAEAWRSRVLPN